MITEPIFNNLSLEEIYDAGFEDDDDFQTVAKMYNYFKEDVEKFLKLKKESENGDRKKE
jgi:hypothetical protein